jgi:hypothetical protein
VAGVRGRVWAVLLVIGGACGPMRGPDADPDEHVRGEHVRMVPETIDVLWPALERALVAEGLEVDRADRGDGILETRAERLTEREELRRLPQIGDLAGLRGALRGLSEVQVAYQLLVRGADEERTRLTVRSTIEAVVRQELYLGPGLLQIVPRRIPVPSRGVLERELLRRLGADVFMAEEMLFLLGEMGVD